MSKIEQALCELNRMERASVRSSPLHALDARAKLLVTLLFLVCVLSLPAADLAGVILYLVYPIISAAVAGISYGIVFRRSLLVLPFVLFVGIFNPIFDRQVVFSVGGVAVTSGWLSFLSIVLRGLLSAQAVFILIYATGFYNLCRGMRRMGAPSLLATQLLFVYRYLFVLLQEALSMRRAREARGFGRRGYPLKMWGVFIGQLLLRTIGRSERIHRAMLSRGFNGSVEGIGHQRWGIRESVYVFAWACFFLLLRVHQSTAFFARWLPV